MGHSFGYFDCYALFAPRAAPVLYQFGYSSIHHVTSHFVVVVRRGGRVVVGLALPLVTLFRSMLLRRGS